MEIQIQRQPALLRLQKRWWICFVIWHFTHDCKQL